MGQVVLKIHVSLDGYIRAGDGEVMEWIHRSYDDELTEWEAALLWRSGVHVMGRRLYEDMAAYWPSSTDEFAAPMNEIPKVVFSKTLERAEWGPVRIVRGDEAGELARLRRESGRNVLIHGGAELSRSLASARLIDEFQLVVHPVVLGGGLPLFTEPMDLKLKSARQFPSGAVALTYERGAGETGEDVFVSPRFEAGVSP